MKVFLVTFFLFFTIFSIGQNNLSTLVESDSLSNQTKVKKSRYVIFPGCETEEDKYECYANKLQDFIAYNMSKEAKEHLALYAEIDTIVLYANIEYDKTGNKILDKSRLLSFVKDFDSYLIPIKYALPKVEPALDYMGKPKTNSVALTLGFFIDKKTNSIVPLYGYQPQLEPQQFKYLKVVEKLPVHPNCNEDVDYETLKQCVNKKITDFVFSNFNQKLLSKTNLPVGKYKVLTFFKIDSKGYIIDVKANGSHKIVENEAIRILKLLPRFKPGSLRDKPIIFPYTLPIVFEVKENNKIKN